MSNYERLWKQAPEAKISLTENQAKKAQAALDRLCKMRRPQNDDELKPYECDESGKYWIYKPSTALRNSCDMEFRMILEIKDEEIVVHTANQRDVVYKWRPK